MSTDAKLEVLENSELINWAIFSELLLMDEDEEGFAQSLITTFVEQALGIFKQMDDLLSDKSEKNDANLTSLSNLGHYLKGSAAALGLQKIQHECERIQNYGARIPFDGYEPSENAKETSDWFECCADALEGAKKYFKESGKLLSECFDEDFFANNEDTQEPKEDEQNEL